MTYKQLAGVILIWQHKIAYVVLVSGTTHLSVNTFIFAPGNGPAMVTEPLDSELGPSEVKFKYCQLFVMANY